MRILGDGISERVESCRVLVNNRGRGTLAAADSHWRVTSDLDEGEGERDLCAWGVPNESENGREGVGLPLLFMEGGRDRREGG